LSSPDHKKRNISIGTGVGIAIAIFGIFLAFQTDEKVEGIVNEQQELSKKQDEILKKIDENTDEPATPESSGDFSVKITGPKTMVINTLVTYTSDESQKPQNGYIKNYQWNVDGKKVSEKSFLEYTFENERTYQIDLIAFDDKGNERRDTMSITVHEGDLDGDGILDEEHKSEPQFLYSDTPYLSFDDSPFLKFKDNSTYFFIENFENGKTITTPGVTGTGEIVGKKYWTDSVDLDDKIEDGSGLNGYSFYLKKSSIIFTFDESELGSLPNYAGFVVTDASEKLPDGTLSSTKIIFEARGYYGTVLGSIGPVDFGDGNYDGQTNEDRFFGITSDEGIKQIKISRLNGVGFEVDHLQYGRLN